MLLMKRKVSVRHVEMGTQGTMMESVKDYKPLFVRRILIWIEILELMNLIWLIIEVNKDALNAAKVMKEFTDLTTTSFAWAPLIKETSLKQPNTFITVNPITIKFLVMETKYSSATNVVKIS